MPFLSLDNFEIKLEHYTCNSSVTYHQYLRVHTCCLWCSAGYLAKDPLSKGRVIIYYCHSYSHQLSRNNCSIHLNKLAMFIVERVDLRTHQYCFFDSLLCLMAYLMTTPLICIFSVKRKK